MFFPSGIVPAVVTPFDGDENLDEGVLRRHVGRLLEGGVHGVFVAGSTGEAYALDAGERDRLVRTTVEAVAGRVPVYAGTGTVTTRETVRLSRAAQEAGADVLSVITPYFVRPNQDELAAHFEAVARAVDLPIVLYNQPPRTGVTLETATVAQLAGVENIVGIKDSSGSLTQTMQYVAATPDDFAVLVGNDALIAPAVMMGAAGSIAASASVAPRLLVDLYEAARAGDIARARELQHKILGFRSLFETSTFPGIIREAVALGGVPVGKGRSPVGEVSPEVREQLVWAMEKMDLPVEATTA